MRIAALAAATAVAATVGFADVRLLSSSVVNVIVRVTTQTTVQKEQPA